MWDGCSGSSAKKGIASSQTASFGCATSPEVFPRDRPAQSLCIYSASTPQINATLRFPRLNITAVPSEASMAFSIRPHRRFPYAGPFRKLPLAYFSGFGLLNCQVEVKGVEYRPWSRV
jgi:hypothetical protein